MPRRDGTGPMGIGPATGRGYGVCRKAMNHWDTSSFRFRYGKGYGRGLGRCLAGYGFSSRNRREFLEEQMEFLKGQMDEVSKELDSMNNDAGKTLMQDRRQS